AQPASVEVKVIQPENWTKLQTMFLEKKSTLGELREGKADPKEKESAEAIDIAAQYYSYRVTWPNLQNAATHEMDKAFLEFENEIKGAVRNLSYPYLKALAEKMAKYCKDVMDSNSKAIARINSARLLARLAEAGLDETADVLTEEANKNDQYEAVKYYALKGLKALVGAANQPKSTVFTGPKGAERQAKAIQALVTIVDRKPPIPEALTPEEMNGFRKVRLEAIEGLANFRKPAVLDDKGNIKVPVARALIEVIQKEGMVPQPRIEEQVAAAAGLGNMQVKGFPTYQPSYAALQVAPFFLEFATRYQDRANGGRDAKEPWKIYAARLIESLDSFRRENAGNNDLTTVIDQFLTILKAIEDGAQVNPGELKQWLADHPPKAETSLFKGIPDTKLKQATPDEKEKPAKPPETDKKK
ncbi:MAG TPA: hypothetical protein VGZ25_09480, partial [Gemmataceae bacterium]|nr:hypothetical protein [Gemmataceae bacterium]